ncbi:hypothetical protein FAGAP_5028 [Fusarium agapanthi]|uniref:Uncharacterized protein n=1 Tax=Fusarium agapanthi TaxID=1803897 RepID=A0A9P5E7K0_9HYPO|nr:hypothetical protein FAGAP_5028 [Fusarium agapanthi]
MVYLPPNQHGNCLKCYLTTPYTDDELKAFKSAFERGAYCKSAPMMQITIMHAPDDYLGKSHQYLRAKETEADNTDLFIVVDEEAKSRRAAWYIDQPSVWGINYINYITAKSSIEEGLDNCSVDLPLTNDFYQPDPQDCVGPDFEYQQPQQDVGVIAEPGEFEASTDPELLNDFSPRPDKVVRLKEDAADSVGLVSSWTIPGDAKPFDLAQKEFPDGAVVLQQNYKPGFPWPAESL